MAVGPQVELHISRWLLGGFAVLGERRSRAASRLCPIPRLARIAYGYHPLAATDSEPHALKGPRPLKGEHRFFAESSTIWQQNIAITEIHRPANVNPWRETDLGAKLFLELSPFSMSHSPRAI